MAMWLLVSTKKIYFKFSDKYLMNVQIILNIFNLVLLKCKEFLEIQWITNSQTLSSLQWQSSNMKFFSFF